MSPFQRIAHGWTSINLIKRIVVGLAVGILLALVFPGNAAVELLGTLFRTALASCAPILVFFIVISALANAKTSGGMKTVVILYILSMVASAVVAIIASYLFPLTITLADAATDQAAPQGIGEVLNTVILNVVANPVEALANGNYLGILAWAVLIGIAVRGAKQTSKDVFGSISDAVTKVVHWIIQCAPFGVLGLVYTAVSDNGPEIFVEYGQLIVMLVACMLIIALAANPLICFLAFRKNPYPLVLRCLKDSGITAFFTRSSAANIPVNMVLAEKLGLDPNTYSVSIPLGATINMAGATVTITIMTMAAAHTLGIAVDIPSALILCVLAAISACGASGVAGGSLLLIPLACSLFGISNEAAMQVVGIGFIIGVIQDSCETALNSSSDVLFTATTDYRARRKRGILFNPGRDDALVMLSDPQVIERLATDPAVGKDNTKDAR
ncbi:MAG: serine/threonine transporter SstT [Eggerthellaceae bacterium]|nr:serine/threonine transporter SstT [Eggerthellaceae bacterium]